MDPCAAIETFAGVLGVTDLDTCLLVSVRASYEIDEDSGEISGYDFATRRLEQLINETLPGWSIRKHRSRLDARPQTEVWYCCEHGTP